MHNFIQRFQVLNFCAQNLMHTKFIHRHCIYRSSVHQQQSPAYAASQGQRKIESYYTITKNHTDNCNYNVSPIIPLPSSKLLGRPPQVHKAVPIIHQNYVLTHFWVNIKGVDAARLPSQNICRRWRPLGCCGPPRVILGIPGPPWGRR